MREKTLFNPDWLFSDQQLDLDAPDLLFTSIILPHSNREFPHHNFDNQEYQFISTYRKRFSSSLPGKNQQVFLDFDGVMLACTVFLNGKKLLEHRGGFLPFSVDLTPALLEGENCLTVYVDSRERTDIPPFGHMVDYLTFGGIYRDVHLRHVDAFHIENIFSQTSSVLSSPRMVCEVQLSQFYPGLVLKAELMNREGERLAASQAVVQQKSTRLAFDNLPRVQLWSLENPVLHTLAVSLYRENEEIDLLSTRLGFREAAFHPDGKFYLNGEHLKLVGLDRHQTYPYIGAAAPARMQRLDADILKYELGCNIVRTSHYPQSPHFLDRCDEIGLLVFEEIPGWQHIGDDEWQDLSLVEVRGMIERDRNHPSIILWGVRVNESQDNDSFYQRTNALAHELDPSRQTGGVRCFRESIFLEDVFTYNDFSNDVREPNHLPYLITEFAGHMFPTKTWDHEERLIDHALLHARIQDKQMGNEKIAGAIGWCAFDYATHIEFGSGDRICYHGVMDIFRLPKWAAYFYQSQQPPSKKIILQPATHWTMGDRSGGGNNPLTIFSNCEELEVLIGELQVGRFRPDRETYPHLAHPPFTIRGLDQYTAWGQRQFYDLHVKGFIGGRLAAEHHIASDRLPQRLELATDVNQLLADGADMTRLIVRITDQYGNPLPYAVKIVTFDVEGEADLIGENPFPLIGGQAALLVKARQQAGRVTIRARAPGIPEVSVVLDVVPVTGGSSG